MTVTASTLVASSAAPPATPNGLWEPLELFSHNWIDSFSITTRWLTRVSMASSVAEERRGMLAKPVRTISVHMTPLREQQVDRLRTFFMRAGTCRFPFPLYPDRLWCAAYSSSGIKVKDLINSTYVATTPARLRTRRFQLGGRVVVIRGRKNVAERDAVIGSRQAFYVPTSFQLSSGNLDYFATSSPPATYTAGDRVYPVIECLPVLGSDAEVISGQVASGTFTFEECPGLTALEPFVSPGTAPSNLPTYTGLPVLSLLPWHEGKQVGVQREGGIQQVGLDRLVSLYGSRGRSTVDLTFWGKSRDQIQPILDLRDYAAGMVRTFWVLSPSVDMTLSTVPDGTHVRVYVGADTADVLRYHGTVAFVKYDGTVVLRGVTGVSTVSTSGPLNLVELTLDGSTTGLSTTTVRRMCWAFQSRFASDETEETWVTDEQCSVRCSFVEVLREQSITLTNLLDPLQGGGTAPAWANCHPRVLPGEGGAVQFNTIWRDDKRDRKWFTPQWGYNVDGGLYSPWVPEVDFPELGQKLVAPGGPNPFTIYGATYPDPDSGFAAVPFGNVMKIGTAQTKGKIEIPSGATINWFEFHASQAGDNHGANCYVSAIFRKNSASNHAGWPYPIINSFNHGTVRARLAAAGTNQWSLNQHAVTGTNPGYPSSHGNVTLDAVTADAFSWRNGAEFFFLLQPVQNNGFIDPDLNLVGPPGDEAPPQTIEFAIGLKINFTYLGVTSTYTIGETV